MTRLNRRTGIVVAVAAILVVLIGAAVWFARRSVVANAELAGFQGAPADRTIVVVAMVSRGDRVIDGRATEDSATVRVRVRVSHPVYGSDPAVLDRVTVPVQLDAPLGSRQVIDAATNQALQPSGP